MKILDVPQSGSVAGVTSSRNRFGQYRRTRATPVNPNTPAQSGIRAILSGCSSNWASLTPTEKTSWNVWAALHPRTDSLGQVYTMTGAQAFNAVNCLLVMIGAAAVTMPPADPVIDPPALVSITPTLASPTAWDNISIDFTPSPVPAGHNLLLYLSPPKSGGSSFCGDLRYLTKALAAATTTVDVAAEYTGKFGVAAEGQNIFARARLIRLADGNVSPWSAQVFAPTQT